MQVTELVCPVAPENLPGTQSVQTVEAVLAAYLPAKQFMQVLAPAVAEYLPASHVKQALGELEKLPAGHWLSTQAEPRPANENLPAVQLIQTDEPVVRAQRQTTSQIHIHMYICIEDVCVCTHIHVVCMYRTYEGMYACIHTHTQ